MNGTERQVTTSISLQDLTLGVLRKAVHLLTCHLPVEPALEAVLKRIMGTHDRALLLERVLYWSQKAAVAGRAEIYATATRWEAECDVSRATVDRAKSVMREFVVIEVKPTTVGRADHYRIDVQKFLQKVADALVASLERVLAAVQQVIAEERAAAAARQGLLQNDATGSDNSRQGVAPERGDGSPHEGATGRRNLDTKTDSIYTDSNTGSNPESPPILRGGGFQNPSPTGENYFSMLQAFFPKGNVAAAMATAEIAARRGVLKTDRIAYATGILRREADERQKAAGVRAIEGDPEDFVRQF